MPPKDELVKTAKELGIEVEDDVEDSDLQELIDTKKKEKESSKSKDPEYLESELKKVIEQRDLAKKERRTLKAKLDEFETKFKDVPKKEDIETMTKELKELKKYKEDVSKKEEEEELKKKTDIEKAEIQFNKQVETLKREFETQLSGIKTTVEEKEKALKEKEDHIQQLRKIRLESDILKSASKYNAYSPSQIVKLLVDDFIYENSLDRYAYYVKDDKGKLKDELSIDERVKEFLSDEENENLVKSEINTDGSGTKTTETPGKVSSGKSKYNVNDKEVKREAEFKSLTPEEVIAIWEIRDEKMAKIKGKK